MTKLILTSLLVIGMLPIHNTVVKDTEDAHHVSNLPSTESAADNAVIYELPEITVTPEETRYSTQSMNWEYDGTIGWYYKMPEIDVNANRI